MLHVGKRSCWLITGEFNSEQIDTHILFLSNSAKTIHVIKICFFLMLQHKYVLQLGRNPINYNSQAYLAIKTTFSCDN